MPMWGREDIFYNYSVFFSGVQLSLANTARHTVGCSYRVSFVIFVPIERCSHCAQNCAKSLAMFHYLLRCKSVVLLSSQYQRRWRYDSFDSVSCCAISIARGCIISHSACARYFAFLSRAAVRGAQRYANSLVCAVCAHICLSELVSTLSP